MGIRPSPQAAKSREVREVGIFLSGPDDVEGEIRNAYWVIDHLNLVLGPRLGIRLRGVRGSRDARAGVGRPQSLINPLIDSCSLVVVVFHRRFGTPTGASASGTKEEFDYAFSLRERTGEPEIFLFFGDIERTQSSRQDSQVEAVLRFKGEIRAGRKLYPMDYSGGGSFFVKLLEQMTMWMLSVYDSLPPLPTMSTLHEQRPIPHHSVEMLPVQVGKDTDGVT
jgi:hypothetical protein